MKNKRNWKSFAAGMLTMAMLVTLGVSTFAAGTQRTINAMIGGIRIVLDGQKINPTDANGNTVEPMIYNGTTYLPVRAVATALGKAVYWDGPNYTVYLGNMDGKLEYPTAMLKDLTSIGNRFGTASDLTDNYGNKYSSALEGYSGGTFEYLLDMKYSRFRATLYVPNGVTDNREGAITITADGKQIYSSPVMDKTSRPVYVDVNITGCNDFKIEYPSGWAHNICIANAGFYQ